MCPVPACVLERFSENDSAMTDTNKPVIEFLEKFEPEVFWHQHGRKIIWGAIAVLAGGVIYVQMQRQAGERETEAATRLAQATEPGLIVPLVKEFSGKNIGAQALLRLAELYSQAGRLPEALAAYQEFLTTYPQHPLVDSAQLGQAASLETAGKLEDAKARYIQLSSKFSGYTAVAAKLGAARCAEVLGQTKEARQYYEELAPVIAGSPWALTTAIRLDVLNRTPEAPVTGIAPLPLSSEIVK